MKIALFQIICFFSRGLCQEKHIFPVFFVRSNSVFFVGWLMLVLMVSQRQTTPNQSCTTHTHRGKLTKRNWKCGKKTTQTDGAQRNVGTGTGGHRRAHFGSLLATSVVGKGRHRRRRITGRHLSHEGKRPTIGSNQSPHLPLSMWKIWLPDARY